MGPPGTPFAVAVQAVRDSEQSVDDAASGLIAQLSETELLGLLDGDLTILRGLRRAPGESAPEPQPR